MNNKPCSHCKAILPLSEFYTSGHSKDGLTYQCKVCLSEFNKKYHMKRRGDTKDKRQWLKEIVIHKYFSVIDTPQKAYFTGLLAADGCVYSNRPRIALSVHINDKILVERFRDEIAPGAPLQYPSGNKMCRLVVTSGEMAKDLSSLGVTPRKSLVLQWPTTMPTSFYPSYVLGFFDGDGHISRDKRKPSPYFTCGFTSASKDFLISLSVVIAEATDLTIPVLTKNNTAHSIRYGGAKCHRLLEWMNSQMGGLGRKRPIVLFS